MSQLDFPLEELKRYKGINPCPKDLDEYWTKALSELDSFDWNVSLEPADFKAPFANCYDLTFTGVGGARIYAKYLRPKNIEGKIPSVVEFHGYHSFSGNWSDKLKYVASGFSFASMDCRGQGGLSQDVYSAYGPTIEGQIIRGLQDGKDNLAYKALFLDTVQLTRIIMNLDEVDESRVGVTGLSQGGGLALACASLEPKISFVAPIYPFLSDYKRVWDMDLDLDAYGELREYFRKYDPMHLKEDETFEMLGYIDIKNLTNRIKGKVLMTITLLDNICPPSTQFAAYNNIKSEKESLIYHDYGHENLPGIPDKIFEFFMQM